MKNISFLIFTVLLFAVNASAALTGTKTICVGATTTWSTTATGGSWISGTTSIATIGSASGVITGIAPGSSLITYAVGTVYDIDTIFVNPVPALTSTVTPPAICDSALFSYFPTSTIPGTSFSWSRAYVPGILAIAGSGTGSVSEMLDNSTSFTKTVTYVYTLTAGSCSNTQNVTVTVNPTPFLSSILSKTICSNTVVNYTPASFTAGTTFAWSRAAVAGITPATGTGTGSITETLVNTTTMPIGVVYVYTLTANGCSHMQNVSVNVDTCGITGVNNYKIQDASINPNPTKSSFQVYLPSAFAEEATITIATLDGKKVKEMTTRTNSNCSLTLDAAAGVYLLTATTAHGVYNSRIVIE